LRHVHTGRSPEVGNRRHRLWNDLHGDQTPGHQGRKQAVSAKAEKELICVPIVHTAADMGGLARSARRLAVSKLGRQTWRQSVDVIGQMWAHIRRTVEGWEIPWEKVRLYQDGLPLCGREKEIARDLAKAGSPNHQLLVSLMSKGATLMGTESGELIVEEYRLAQEILAAKDPEDADRIEAQHKARSRSLIVCRDHFIAGRINESLRAGEIGLLFLGLLHSIEPHLAKDIRVTYPIYKPRHPRRGTK